MLNLKTWKNKHKGLFWIMLLAWLVSCRPQALPTEVNQNCGQWQIPHDQYLDCILLSPENALIQTVEQARLENQGVVLTFNGTIYTSWKAEELVVAVIEGTAVFSATASTRLIPPGGQIIIEFTPDGIVFSDPVPYDIGLIRRLPFTLFARKVEAPAPIAPPPGYTPPPTSTGTPLPLSTASSPIDTQAPTLTTACAPNPDWIDQYPVQRGDTLSSIAARFGLSIEALRAGNCISDANRLSVGQILMVPVVRPTLTEPPATFTPSAVAFRADQGILTPGQCTIIRWDVLNVSSVSFEGEVTTGQNSRQVCPTQTTTYTLQVSYPDGTQSSHTLTIDISTP